MLSARPVGRLAPGSDAWLANRARRVGGSDIAAVLGLSPWESRFSLWHRKQGLIGPVELSEAMHWGNLHEPTIAAEFARLHPELDVREAATFVHRDRGFQTAAPDRLLYPNRITARPSRVLEIKTARSGDEWGTPGSDEVPPYYDAQVQWYLDCLGVEHATLVVLIAGSEYREYHLTYRPWAAVAARDAAAAFIASIDDGVRPSIDEHDATYQAVRELHPDIEDVHVEVPVTVALDYLDACWAEKSAKRAKQVAVAALADAMGSARRATYLGDEIAMRVPGRNGGPPFIRPSGKDT